jgi:hypothetical protein
VRIAILIIKSVIPFQKFPLHQAAHHQVVVPVHPAVHHQVAAVVLRAAGVQAAVGKPVILNLRRLHLLNRYLFWSLIAYWILPGIV